MESFCAVTIQYLDIKNGENINNLILNKQLIYNVNKKKNSYTVDFLINNYDLDLNNLLYKHLGETFCIISENDYNSLINYNNNYYIIEIESHFRFRGNENIVNNVRDKFLNKIKKNISN